MKLLHIDSSITGQNSVTRLLTASIVAEWHAKHADTEVKHLDLTVDSPNHLSADALGFRGGASEGSAAKSAAQAAEDALSEKLVQQFLDADVVVIGAPMYNFTVPTQLKSWIDRIAQPGRTFSYTDKGPVGLAGGKTVIVALARGGNYSTSPQMMSVEHQESYLTVMFGFLGITDIRFVHAEGVAMGDAAKAQAMASATLEIETVAA